MDQVRIVVDTCMKFICSFSFFFFFIQKKISYESGDQCMDLDFNWVSEKSLYVYLYVHAILLQ